MSWLKSNWKALALLAGGAVAMAALTLFILSQREERGFMTRECVEGSGVERTTQWARQDLPVPIYMAVEDAELGPDVEAAIKFWKPYLRFGGMMMPHQELSDPVITVEGDSSLEGHGLAKLSWIGACRVRRVEVKIPMPMQAGDVRRCVVAHELGHALGLDHDDDEDSVMKGVRGALFRCEMTEHDRALLKEAYGE